MSRGCKTPHPVAITCAENIALLYFLHKHPKAAFATPLLPFKNKTSSEIHQRVGYTLPLRLENSLAAVLAYLAHTDDDPNHIPAACIQELPETGTLRLLLAVNRENSTSAREYISNVKNRFEDIFALLVPIEGK